MNRNNLSDWLLEYDTPVFGANSDTPSANTPMGDPYANATPAMDPNVANQPTDMDQDPQQQQQDPNADPSEMPDISNDPQAPDMPEEDNSPDDFEIWKNEYFKQSIKGDPEELLNMLMSVRDQYASGYPEKFIFDNIQVQLLRRDSNILQASNEIRKLMRESLDQNNPATSVVEHIANTLEASPFLNSLFIKMSGYGGNKGDLHRKYIAALIGGVQVGSGADTEDVIWNAREYSVKISTRMNALWGDVALGSWSPQEDDPQRFLSEPEIKRLTEGSPEEKDVLVRRIVMESIANKYEQQSFLISVVTENGEIQHLGWDIATSLRAAYAEGKLVVRIKASDEREAMINDAGEIIAMNNLSILFARETGDQDEDGKPAIEETEFLQKRSGMLFLNAAAQTIQEATPSIQGANFKSVPYTGNPSDLSVLKKCVYTAYDLLMRQCM